MEGGRHTFGIVEVEGRRLLQAFTSVAGLSRLYPQGQEYAAASEAAAVEFVRGSSAEGLLVDGGTRDAVSVPAAAIGQYFAANRAGKAAR